VARALRVGAAEYVAKADAIARQCGGDAPAALTALSEEIRRTRHPVCPHLSG